MRIQSTTQISANAGVKILVFGPAGAGKTRLCATMPNPIIISAEAGLLSLRNFNLPYIEVRNMADFIQAWNWVSTSAEARKFNSICVDSASEIVENILSYQRTQTKDGRKAYGDTQEEAERVLKNFRNLQGPHVYFTAKQEMIKTGEDSKLIAGVMMPGNKLSQSIPFMFDECFQLVPGRTPEGVVYSALRTKGVSEWDTVKDRSGALDEWEMPTGGSNIPNLGALIGKIMSTPAKV